AFYVIEYTLVSTTVWQADNRKTLGFIACQQAVVGGRLEPQLVGSLVARMFPEAQAQQTVAKWFLALSACGLTKIQKALCTIVGKCTQAVWSQKRPIAYQCKVKTCLEVLKSTNMLAGTCPEEPQVPRVRGLYYDGKCSGFNSVWENWRLEITQVPSTPTDFDYKFRARRAFTTLMLRGVRCLNGTRGTGILESMVHSRATCSSAQDLATTYGTLGFRKYSCKMGPQGSSARSDGVLSCLPWHQYSGRHISRRIPGTEKSRWTQTKTTKQPIFIIEPSAQAAWSQKVPPRTPAPGQKVTRSAPSASVLKTSLFPDVRMENNAQWALGSTAYREGDCGKGSGEGPRDASSLAIWLNQGPQAAVVWQMVSGSAPCGTSVVAGKNPEESRGLRTHQVDG
ncbi:hypothetical protein EI555_005023, partial [Monodon monoceros]